MADDNGTIETAINTPLGGLSYKGKRMAELIAVLSLCMLLLLAYVWWEHKQDTRDGQIQLTTAIKDMASPTTPIF